MRCEAAETKNRATNAWARCLILTSLSVACFLQWGMFAANTPPGDQNSPLLNNLNPEQRAAVALPAEHALILAGAGSGKTRVLTTRIAWLLQTGQVSPGGILAVTFTNKAAKEMMTRLSSMLPVNVHGMWIGTFHGLCNRFLRAHFKLANLPQSFQILDTQDNSLPSNAFTNNSSLMKSAIRPSKCSGSLEVAKKTASAPMPSACVTRKPAKK